jgi:hypothetical protein
MSLDGVKKLGERLLDLYSFAEEKLRINDKRKLKELLTAKNLAEYALFKKALKIS